MGIYSITYFINSLGFFLNKKDRKYINILVLFLLIFMSGTRYYMGGSDVYVYEGVYNNVPSPGIVLEYFFTGVNNGVNTDYEIGFLLLCSVIKALHFSYFGFILIWTILFYTLMVKGLKEFIPNWSIFFAVFMYKLMFYDTFISIRQGLTIAIFCFMLQYIRDRKWYFYFPLCFIAFLEHNGAIILFPLYFITYMPTSKKFIRNYALILAPTIFISEKVDLSNLIVRVAEFIGNTHSVEHWTESVETINLLHTLECYVMVILVLCFYKKILSNKRTKEVKLVLQLFMLAIPIFTLFSKWIVLTREKDYFVLMYGIILGYILEGGTTTSFGKQERSFYDDRGPQNALLISLAVIVICFVGMFKFVYQFDDGTLWNFVSFITEGISIFR